MKLLLITPLCLFLPSIVIDQLDRIFPIWSLIALTLLLKYEVGYLAAISQLSVTKVIPSPPLFSKEGILRSSASEITFDLVNDPLY